MRFSLSLMRGGKLTRAEAQACLTANLGFPGVGSLMGGRVVGYWQMLVAVAGLGLTLIFGVVFLVWSIQNLQQLREPEGDPFAALVAIWVRLRWALGGIVIFGVAWVWALVTSLSILRTPTRRGLLP